MIGTGPIRISTDEWVVIRNNPNVPAAVIRLIDRGLSTEHYRVVTFDLVPALRKLVGRYRTLEAANDAVRFPVPRQNDGPPNGRDYKPVSPDARDNSTQ